MAELAKTSDYDKHEEQNQILPPSVESSIINVLAKAELDVALMIAQQRKRVLSEVMENIQNFATMDAETAASCMYALPRGGKPIKGPSIRFAEIIHSQYGNCGASSRVVATDRVNKLVIAQGVFHDYQTNTKTHREIQRRISDKNGRLFNDDMIIMTGNAAAAIAQRNAILAGVPHGVYNRAYLACERVVAGDVQTLVDRRSKAMKAFAAFGVTPEQVFASLGVKGIDDITLEHMPVLIAAHSALKNGEETVETMFSQSRISAGGFTAVKNPLADDPQKNPLPEHIVRGSQKSDPDSSHRTNQETGPGEDPGSAGAADSVSRTESAASDDDDDEARKLNNAFAAGRKAKREGISTDELRKRELDKSDEGMAWMDGWNSLE